MKPPYRVPCMGEIADLPWNGFNVVSTFSGGGGSSLGYRMAGYKIRWASEFVPAAQDTYRANQAPHTVLDTRDIRKVTGAEILSASGLGVGEIDIFDGSPPCASFSVVGKKQAGWGSVRKYSDTKQRTDDLFFEYIRLINETRPRTFVAENVAGLVQGVSKGYFLEILKALKGCGYQVSAKVLNAAWLGVPQTRNRLIFVGVRDDLGMAPVHPRPLSYQYSVRDVLPYIAAQGGKIDRVPPHSSDRPSGVILTNPTKGGETTGYNGHVYPVRDADDVTLDPETGYNIRLIHDTRGTIGLSQGDVTDRTVPPITGSNDQHIVQETEGHCLSVDPETGQKIALEGYAISGEWQKLSSGKWSGKYMNLVKPDTGQPIPTITQSGGSSPGTAGVTHWGEPRKMTLVELRAISSFPPDFVLTGSYSQRWERVGRAVPPVMMSHVAATIRDEILTPLRDKGII